MNLQISDLLRYFDGSQNHLCYIVIAPISAIHDSPQTYYVEWITEYGRRDFNSQLPLMLGDFSYGGWTKLS